MKVQDGDVQRTKLEPDPGLAPFARRMFRECLSGKGLVEIAMALDSDGLTTRTGKPWTKTTVHKVLHNEGLSECSSGTAQASTGSAVTIHFHLFG